MSGPRDLGRRTHGAFHTQQEAVREARNLGALLNGVPPGYGFYVAPRLGAWVFFSQKVGR